MTVFELLTLRSEYEDIVLNLRVPGELKPGTLDNMQWFTQNGKERNKRKKGVNRALEIATVIVKHETDRKKRK